jgi:hypothetical protein
MMSEHRSDIVAEYFVMQANTKHIERELRSRVTGMRFRDGANCFRTDAFESEENPLEIDDTTRQQ